MSYRLPRRPSWSKHQWLTCDNYFTGQCGYCESCRYMKLLAAEHYILALKDECKRLADERQDIERAEDEGMTK